MQLLLPFYTRKLALACIEFCIELVQDAKFGQTLPLFKGFGNGRLFRILEIPSPLRHLAYAPTEFHFY